MAEKKTRKSYKCGKCGDKGHNARKCPTAEAKAATPAPAPAPVPVEEAAPEAPKAEEKKPEPVNTVAISQNSDVALNYNKEDVRPARPAAPFECPVCLRVGILAILELQGGQKVMRCEHCYTKANPVRIMKWGALPGDKPADAPGHVGRWGVNSRPADAF